MPMNMSNFDNVLQEYYLAPIRHAINNEVPLFKHLEETDKEWTGRRVIFPVHSSRNSGIGARADGGTLPTAGQQGYLQAITSATYNYCRIQVTGPVLRSSQHAFASAMASEIEGAVGDFANDLGRQAWGTGDGRLAQVNTAVSGTAIAVINRFLEPQQPGARYMFVGQLFDIGSVASPTGDGTGVTVQAITISQNPATTTDSLNVSGTYAATVASASFLFNRAAGGSGIEMMGVQALVDVLSEANMWNTTGFASATVQNISRTAQPTAWDALVLGNSGTTRIVDSNLLQTAFDRIQTETGVEPDFIMAHHDVIRAVLDSVSADRRYVTGSLPKYDAGFSDLSYNGIKLIRDRQAPYNCLLMLHRSALKLATLLDTEWADDDGAVLSRVANQDAYEAYLRRYGNIMLSEWPKRACFIRDIRTDL